MTNPTTHLIRTALTGLLIGSLAATSGQAQSPADSVALRRNVIKTTPLFVLGHISLFYERAVSERVSWVGGVGYGWQTYRYENNSTNVPSPGRFNYQRITIERRHYFVKRYQAPMLLYWGLYGRLARLTMNDYTFDRGQFVRNTAGVLVKEKRTIYVLTPGVMGGVQVALGRVMLDVSLGLHTQKPSDKVPFSPAVAEALSSEGFGMRLGFSVGYLF